MECTRYSAIWAGPSYKHCPDCPPATCLPATPSIFWPLFWFPISLSWFHNRVESNTLDRSKGKGKSGVLLFFLPSMDGHLHVADALNQTIPPPPKSSPTHFTLKVQVHTGKKEKSFLIKWKLQKDIKVVVLLLVNDLLIVFPLIRTFFFYIIIDIYILKL